MTVPARTYSSPGEQPQGLLLQQNLQVPCQPDRLCLVRADHDQRPPGPPGHGGGNLGPVDSAQAGDGGGAVPPLHGLGQRVYLRDTLQDL